MKILKSLCVIVVVLVIGIQLVPVDRSNPPVTAEVKAPPQVMQVLRRACYDCHSNETVWPWYAHVAPVSWLVADDVHEGRHEMNFSEWGTFSEKKQRRRGEGVWDEVGEGNMPLPIYLRMHPEAELSEADKAVLRDWSQSFDDDGG